nr:MAG TPA: Replication associated protein [Caudoviricetes sp.]
MYVRNEISYGDLIDVENHYPGNYGAPGKPREKKRKRTSDEMERQNRTNREKFLQRLIVANFNPGDWHLILNYKPDKKPEYGESKKQIRKFLRAVRDAYRVKKIPFKYIVVTERGKKGKALHHHLIIQDITAGGIHTQEVVKEIWCKRYGYGNTIWTDLYEDGEYKSLAAYIVKKETKTDGDWATYSRSRNLILPKKKTVKLRRRKWPEEPKPRKGYVVLKDSIVEGLNPVTGHPWQHYTMRRIRKGGEQDGEI